MARFCIVGGDGRFLRLARILQQRGQEAFSLFDAAELPSCGAADAVVLPAPAPPARGAVSGAPDIRAGALLRAMRAGTALFGGLLPSSLREEACAAGLIPIDYCADETLQRSSAAATAEGALALLIEALPVTLAGSRIGVMGYGQIAQALAARLRALGADTLVFARSETARTAAKAQGHTALPLEALETPQKLAALCNTVPAQVFGETGAVALGTDALCLELASRPGGFTEGAKTLLGARLRAAPGLPGRFSPETAARDLADTLLRLLPKNREEGI